MGSILGKAEWAQVGRWLEWALAPSVLLYRPRPLLILQHASSLLWIVMQKSLGDGEKGNLDETFGYFGQTPRDLFAYCS